jgi:hypothetical protein
MVSALYCESDSIYKTLGIDVWDKKRDARLYPGENPVICHPPCQQWSRLHSFSRLDLANKKLALTAIDQVRRYGGVLEHPNGSHLWSPGILSRSSKPDEYGGFTISINQSWFGHPCKKTTLLYICGCHPGELPPYPISFEAIQYTVGNGYRSKQELPKHLRNKTPIAFARWLISLAEICQPGPLNYII